MVDIVATLAEAASGPAQRRVLGVYLLRVTGDVHDDEIMQECLAIYWRSGGARPPRMPAQVMVSCRKADPLDDARLYEQCCPAAGITIH